MKRETSKHDVNRCAAPRAASATSSTTRARSRSIVHGVIVNSYLWRRQLVDLFAERRCIAVDFLGHGRTEVKNLAAR